MKILNALRHIGIILAGLFLILGLPFLTSDYFSTHFLSADSDAVSSASVILDQPSGEFLVLINSDLHTKEDRLNEWISYFSGEEIDIIFEDIACSVAESDSSAIELARSFQSRLPENQMKLQKENITLLLSRVEAGKYDIFIISKEFADAYSLDWEKYAGTKMIEVTGEGNSDSVAESMTAESMAAESMTVESMAVEPMMAAESVTAKSRATESLTAAEPLTAESRAAESGGGEF